MTSHQSKGSASKKAARRRKAKPPPLGRVLNLTVKGLDGSTVGEAKIERKPN